MQLIMQLLRDNLTLWTSDLQEPSQPAAAPSSTEKSDKIPASENEAAPKEEVAA